MSLVRERDGKRLHIKSRLMGESLVRKSLYNDMDIPPQIRLFPDVNVVKIGGQSICDRGIKALPAIIKEIASVKKKHKILLTTGGGTRSRKPLASRSRVGARRFSSSLASSRLVPPSLAAR